MHEEDQWRRNSIAAIIRTFISETGSIRKELVGKTARDEHSPVRRKERNHRSESEAATANYR